MTARRFNLPAKLPIQIIGPTTLQKAREAYSARWGRPWPESDSYLAELIIEAKEIEGLPPGSKARPGPNGRCRYRPASAGCRHRS